MDGKDVGTAPLPPVLALLSTRYGVCGVYFLQPGPVSRCECMRVDDARATHYRVAWPKEESAAGRSRNELALGSASRLPTMRGLRPGASPPCAPTSTPVSVVGPVPILAMVALVAMVAPTLVGLIPALPAAPAAPLVGR